MSARRSEASGGIAGGIEQGEERWGANEGKLRISKRRGNLMRASWPWRRRVLAMRHALPEPGRPLSRTSSKS
jgi:hypothetical protein